jgi:hypothetical protein
MDGIGRIGQGPVEYAEGSEREERAWQSGRTRKRDRDARLGLGEPGAIRVG